MPKQQQNPLEVLPIETVEQYQEYRQQVVDGTQHLLDAMDTFVQMAVIGADEARADVVTARKMWLNDLEKMLNLMMYSHLLRQNLQGEIEENRDLKESIERADTEHPELANYLEMVKGYLQAEFTEELLTEIINANGGMTDIREAAGVIAAAKGHSITEAWQSRIAEALRQMADRVEQKSAEKGGAA